MASTCSIFCTASIPRELFFPGLLNTATPGIRSFTETYGVLETITTTTIPRRTPAPSEGDQAVKERPGASPLLFGRFLMDIGAFVSLEDISANLPPYTEEVISVPMDKPLAEAYAETWSRTSQQPFRNTAAIRRW